MQIQDICREAGVVGCGGPGFPTHVKLSSQVEYVLGNCAECEPLLRLDNETALHYAEEIMEGLRYAVQASGASRGFICIKTKHVKEIEMLRKYCTEGLEVFLLKDFFPAGDEQQLIYEVLGKVVPTGGLPMDVGCIVQNANTLRNIARAMKGIPVTRKVMTISGAVREPMTVEAPIGMSMREVVALAGGPEDIGNYGLIIGGPMMGQMDPDWNSYVTKITSAVIVMRKDHPHWIHKNKDIGYNIKMARTACCQCSLCTQMCPRNLLGLQVKPHLAMRAAAFGKSYEANGIFSCSNCGICSFYVCPFGLTPSAVMQQMKADMMKKGIRAVKTESIGVWESREYCRIPTGRLKSRLGVQEYDAEAPLNPAVIETEEVRIPLKMHVGAPCEPLVSKGEAVQEGQVIGVPPKDALGVNIHASISGTVTEVTDTDIWIHR